MKLTEMYFDKNGKMTSLYLSLLVSMNLEVNPSNCSGESCMIAIGKKNHVEIILGSLKAISNKSIGELSRIPGVIQVLIEPPFFKLVFDDAEIKDLRPNESYEVTIGLAKKEISVLLIYFEENTEPFKF